MAQKIGLPYLYKEEAKQSVLLRLAKTQLNTSLSNFTISCDGQEWKVHRLVLSLHSSVLAKACDGSFKEASERHMDLPDDDPAAVNALVHYLYHLDYKPHVIKSDECESSALCFHIRVCVVADKYDIQPLKKLATANFKLMVNEPSTDSAFIKAALLAYETPQATQSMCSAIIEHVVATDLLKPSKKNKERTPVDSPFTTATRQSAELAADVATALYSHRGFKDDMARLGERRYHCPGPCGRSQIMNMGDDSAMKFACFGCKTAYTMEQWCVYTTRVTGLW